MTQSRWDLAGAVAGIAFALLFFATLMIVKLPGGDDTNQVYADYFIESDRFTDHTIVAYMIAAAGIAFLVFLSSLRDRLLARDPDAGLHTLALGSGLLFVGALFVAGAAAYAVPASIEIGEETQFGADIARVPWVASIVLLLYGMIAASSSIAALSALMLRTRALPKWLAVFGFVAAFILLFGYVYLPDDDPAGLGYHGQRRPAPACSRTSSGGWVGGGAGVGSVPLPLHPPLPLLCFATRGEGEPITEPVGFAVSSYSLSPRALSGRGRGPSFPLDNPSHYEYDTLAYHYDNVSYCRTV
ncbi:hypothetical protein BH23CHL2_BH23CHL2_24000 [soil metagenome]